MKIPPPPIPSTEDDPNVMIKSIDFTEIVSFPTIQRMIRLALTILLLYGIYTETGICTTLLLSLMLAEREWKAWHGDRYILQDQA